MDEEFQCPNSPPKKKLKIETEDESVLDATTTNVTGDELSVLENELLPMDDQPPPLEDQSQTADDQTQPVENESQTTDEPPPLEFSEDITETDTNAFSINGGSYDHVIPPEEVEKLKEFQVLDELKSNDEESDGESSASDGKSEGIPEEDIDKMLEEDLPQDYRGAPKPKEKPYVTRQKIVLEEKGTNKFEVLPLDWITVPHYSGMPVYLHRPTRVCTLAKPYFIGKGKSRRHEIPISAIPCLAYRKGLEEEEKQKEIDRRIEEKIKSGTWRNSVKNTTPNPIYNHKIKTLQLATARTNTEVSTNNEVGKSDKPSQSNECKSTEKIDEVKGQKSAEPKCPFSDNSNGDQNILGDSSEVVCDKMECDDVKEVEDSLTSDINAGEDNNVVNNHENTEEGENIVVNNHENTEKEENSVVNNHEDTENAVENNDASSNDKDNATESTKMTEEEARAAALEEELDRAAEPVVLPGGIVMAPPRVETVETSWKTQFLTPEQLNEYCKNLFKFKTINILQFVRWADRHRYGKASNALQQHPALPAGTKLITIPAPNKPDTANNTGVLGLMAKGDKRDWVMNMNGRSYLSVFHEYVRRALNQQPVYEFQQLENATTPYQATVYIGGMQYGVGRGSSKRAAKANAARESIAILIPHMKLDTEQTEETDDSFFDYVGIEDPRITEFCAVTCEPAPHAILRTCLLRNFGSGESHIHTEMKELEYQKIELTMRVGKHTATVVCKNKKTAKQRASQAILQLLHPHVKTWGSLLRLYGSRSVKSCKEKKLEEQQITLLQDKAQHNEPNFAVLEKLKEEMERLRSRDKSFVPIGTLLIKNDLPEHSGSNLKNVDM